MSAYDSATSFQGRSLAELEAEFPDDEIVIYRDFRIRDADFPRGAEALILIPRTKLAALREKGEFTPLAQHGSLMVRR